MSEADFYRNLPKVDTLAGSARLSSYPWRVRVEAARAGIGRARKELAGVGFSGDVSALAEDFAVGAALEMTSLSLRPLVNASGVILHTGAGRARLAPSVAAHVAAVAAGHSSVELDLESGQRGDRQSHVRELICGLSGAEDALVVNNCAAAVFLALSALCSGQDVVLSRGEMIEIGGSFRLPDIVRQSGCRLVEVGCTNKTHLEDFASAIGPETAAILRCHPSNYRIVGFTEAPSVEALAQLTREKGILLIDDLGSGCLVDTTRFGLPREPQLGESLRLGAHLAMASGDKMLGGPQAGILVGESALIARTAKHPLARAMRVDKLTLAALEATLRLYVEGRELEIPTLWALARSLDDVLESAERLAGSWAGAAIESGVTETGGGSLPGAGVPTWRVGLGSRSCDELALGLRRRGIVSRIEKGLVWLDPRTVTLNEEEQICRALTALKS